jgi:hypothetical protein
MSRAEIIYWLRHPHYVRIHTHSRGTKSFLHSPSTEEMMFEAARELENEDLRRVFGVRR